MFKCSKYRHAYECYTEGLKQALITNDKENAEAKKPDDYVAECRELKSVLYSNRAAAQFHMKNFRSSLADCVFARKINMDNIKPILKGNFLQRTQKH
jgi:hypothetical protein